MKPEDKKKLQNDILLAAEISRQFNLKNPEEAQKVVMFIHNRKPFLSARGAAFQQRMEALAEGDNTSCTCMLCMQNEAERGVFCSECLEVIDRSVNRDVPKEQPQEEPKEAVQPEVQPEPVEPIAEEVIEEPELEEIPEVEPEFEEISDVTEEEIAEPELDEIPEEEIPELEEISFEPEAEELEEVVEEKLPVEELPEEEPIFFEEEEEPQVDTDLWGATEKERPKFPIWVRILLGFFVVVILAVGILLVTGYRLSDLPIPIGEITVESQEDGATVVEREYSDKDYTITDKESLNAPEGMFDVRVGDYVGDSWDTGLIAVYAYSVVSKEDPEQSAVLWVAEDGRTVGYGTLIDAENPNKIYRLR